MNPFAIAQLGMSVVSGIGQIQAGRAQRRAAELTAFRTQTEGELNKAMARQRAEARREEYNQATAANIAAFSVTRDIGSDRSVQAFLERQKEVVAQDLGRMDTQAAFESAKYQAAAATEIRRGKNIQRASLISGLSTMAQGAYRYDQTRT